MKTGQRGDHQLRQSASTIAGTSTLQCIRPSASAACESYLQIIQLGLSRGRNAMAIQHDMVTQHDFNGGFQLVTGTVRKLRSFAKRDPVGVIMTAPREEARVDYGTGPSVREEKSGKYQRTREFVITLAKKDSDSREWAKNNLPI